MLQNCNGSWIYLFCCGPNVFHNPSFEPPLEKLCVKHLVIFLKKEAAGVLLGVKDMPTKLRLRKTD